MTPLAFVLLGLAAFRTWKLLAEDLILEPARKGPLAREGWIKWMVECAWCLGAWLSVAWWAAWQAWPHWTLVVAVPFALSTLVGAVATALNALSGDS